MRSIARNLTLLIKGLKTSLGSAHVRPVLNLCSSWPVSNMISFTWEQEQLSKSCQKNEMYSKRLGAKKMKCVSFLLEEVYCLHSLPFFLQKLGSQNYSLGLHDLKAFRRSQEQNSKFVLVYGYLTLAHCSEYICNWTWERSQLTSRHSQTVSWAGKVLSRGGKSKINLLSEELSLEAILASLVTFHLQSQQWWQNGDQSFEQWAVVGGDQRFKQL